MDDGSVFILECFMMAVVVALYVQFASARATRQRIAELQAEIDDLKRRL